MAEEATAKVQDLTNQIKSWDKESVYKLRDLLRELFDVVEQSDLPLEQFIDITELPSCDIPEDLDTTYPVWSIDIEGRCLVGEGLDGIEHVDSVREVYRRR